VSRGRGAHAGAAGIGDAGAEARRAEREETRQVTRELHEAVQAAKDAARDLRQAQNDAGEWADGLRDELCGMLRDQLTAIGNKYVDAVSARLEAGHEGAQKLIDNVRDGVSRLQATYITGAGDPGAMLQAVVTALSDAITPIFTGEDFQQQLARLILDMMDLETGGAMTRVSHIQRQIGAAVSEQVFVRTARPGEEPGLYEGYRP
jgi:hypothetical protein